MQTTVDFIKLMNPYHCMQNTAEPKRKKTPWSVTTAYFDAIIEFTMLHIWVYTSPGRQLWGISNLQSIMSTYVVDLDNRQENWSCFNHICSSQESVLNLKAWSWTYYIWWATNVGDMKEPGKYSNTVEPNQDQISIR